MPSPRQVQALLAKFDCAQSWQTRLHLLQLIPHLNLGPKQAELLFTYCRCHLADDNKFVRAWAYGGLLYAAWAKRDLSAEAEALIKLAEGDESASVLARIRQARKHLAHRSKSVD